MAAVSEEALERQRAHRRELYYWYKEHGICTRCQGEAIPGKTLCPDCMKKRRQQAKRWRKEHPDAHKDRYYRLKSEGKCVQCGETAKPGLTLCKKCMDKLVERQHVRRIRKRVREGKA